MTTADFTDKELTVLRSMYESMNGNGFDFGCTEDIKPAGMPGKTVRGVLRELHKKIEFHVDEPVAGYHQISIYWPEGELAYNSTFEEWLAAIPAPRNNA